jgi:hypothetical protein
MKEDRKKEIDLKWRQLISKIDKPQKTEEQNKAATRSSKVIRRRKGNPDLHIT